MIDYFTLALTHGLIALAIVRLLFRADLDTDGAGGGAARRSRTGKRNEPGDA